MPKERNLKLPVPCAVIFGGPGSGKTTFIGCILQNKPDGEVWAVLANNSYAGATLGAFNAANGIHMRSLGGACVCCTAANITEVCIAQLVRSSKPDRLIVEPSGLADPGALLRVLSGSNLASALKVDLIVSIVDGTALEEPKEETLTQMEARTALALAGVIVGSKLDVASGAGLAAFTELERELSAAGKKVLRCGDKGHVPELLAALGLAAR
jgi:G3E family GTPase